MVAKKAAIQKISNAAALILTLVAGASLAPLVRAADFTVLNGASVGQQNLADPGDTGRVEAGGTVSTTANSDHAVIMSATGQVFDSSGSLSTLGGSAFSIYSLADDVAISNNGSISTAGGTGIGIRSLGDDTVITNSGSISTTGNFAFGVFAIGSSTSITNSGSISMTGSSADGIRAFGSSISITNSGSISTTGDDAEGIYSTAPRVVITNSGSISTTGDSAYAVNSRGTFAVINNSGQITAAGDSAHGINSTRSDAEINNSGSISASGDDADGIFSSGDDAVITSSGSISTSGADADGIFSSGDGTSITNSGSIATTGTNAPGIYSSGANGQVINSGRIVALQSNAIEFDGNQNNTLTLLPGSSIQGRILLGGGSDTLVIGKGLSVNISFDKIPEVIDAQGAVFAASGTQVVTVDAAAMRDLSVQDEQIADLTGGVSTLLENRLSSLRGQGSVSQLAGSGGNAGMYQIASLEALDYGEADGLEPESPFWVQGFGSYRRQDDGDGGSETAQWQRGLVAGADQLYGDVRAGVFVGAAWANAEVVSGSQESETRGFFLGAYSSLERQGLIFDFALTGGYNAIEQEREVLNNTVSGGVEKATADYGGWFISPEVSVTLPGEFLGHAIEPGLSLRYAGLFLDDYTEEGVASPLTIEGRDLHMGIARAQLALPGEAALDNGDVLRYRFKAGAELRRSFGDESIDGVLLGKAVSFDSGDDDSVLGGFLGLSGEYDDGSGTVFFLSTEGLLESEGSYQVYGQAGLRFRL